MSERIIEFIKKKGPIVPMDLASELKTNSIIASAHLSELISKKLIKMSTSLKLGTSPLYYLPEQKKDLEKFIDSLNSKDKDVWQLLKNGGVLRDSKCTPLQRVSLRNMKDFAVPLEVTYKDNKEIFWKYYLLTNDQASEKIKTFLSSPKAETSPLQKEEIKPETTTSKEDKTKDDSSKDPSKDIGQLNGNKKIEHKEQKKETEEKTIPKTQITTNNEPRKNEEKKDGNDQIDHNKKEEQKEDKRDNNQTKKQETQIVEQKSSSSKDTETNGDDQSKIKKPINLEDNFLRKVHDFLNDLKVQIIEYDIIKKNSDIDMIIEVQSNLGSLTYFCKAKKKKRLNESDISSAYVGGQLKKLPVIILTPGEFTKSSKELLEKQFKGIKVIRIK